MTRPLAERCHRLDVAAVTRAGWLVPGAVGVGSLPPGLTVRADLTGQRPWSVHVTDYASGYRRVAVITLTTTSSSVGGIRWWLVCPATNRPVRVLFRPVDADLFACRRVHRIAYASQGLSDAGRTAARAAAARRTLGISETITPVRPKGMHATTYARLLAAIEAAP